MNTQEEATLDISYPKALLVSLVSMMCFAIGLCAIGIPLRDPLLIGFLVFMVTVLTFIFAGCMCFMLRCKIGRDGLRPAVPTFYQRVFRWEDISVVRGFASPFYSVRCYGLGGHCLLPRRFLLKQPDSLKELLERFAPEDNILRKKLTG
jgi:hypothetical protein